MSGKIYVGIGGWNFEPWRGAFYPDTLSQKKELEYASRHVTSIEVNATYYGGFKPDTFRKWAGEAPDGFVFSLKASRFCTNRKVLAEGGDSMGKFLNQGITELGPKLGPINWQFMGTKKFDPADFGAFLAMLPKELDGLKLRHVVEVRSPTFCTPDFYALAKQHNVAICYARDEDFPEIDQATADFTYARLMCSHEDLEAGVTDEELEGFAAQCRDWAKRGDVFAYFIAGAKVRNPAAAMALIKKLNG